MCREERIRDEYLTWEQNDQDDSSPRKQTTTGHDTYRAVACLISSWVEGTGNYYDPSMNYVP